MVINLKSESYKNLCTEYYDLDKPYAPKEALDFYLTMAQKAKGPILEPMCGTGRFLIPLVEAGYKVVGFDNSEQMLNVCRQRCQEKKLEIELKKCGFEDFVSTEIFNLVFIPSGSFGLLTDLKDSSKALDLINKWLSSDGKFVFEIETLHAAEIKPGFWKASWVKKPDGSLIVLNYACVFDEITSIQTILCRYELWSHNEIVQTEVEEFCVRLYSIEEIEMLLNGHGFKITNKLIPYTEKKANKSSESVLFECVKI